MPSSEQRALTIRLKSGSSLLGFLLVSFLSSPRSATRKMEIPLTTLTSSFVLKDALGCRTMDLSYYFIRQRIVYLCKMWNLILYLYSRGKLDTKVLATKP